MARLGLPRTATALIAVVTALVSLGILFIGGGRNAAALLGVIPARLSGSLDLALAIPAWLTPLSATLIHADLLHLAFNLIMLVLCGRPVERIIGGGPLGLLYCVGAFVSAGAQWLVAPHSPVPMIGASGAISALVGAFALSYGRPKLLVKSLRLNRAINIAWLLAAWIIIQLLVAFVAGQQGLLLATPAHIGGFLAGLALQRPLLMWRYRDA